MIMDKNVDLQEMLHEEFQKVENERELLIKVLKPVVREVEEAVTDTIGSTVRFQTVESILSNLDELHLRTYDRIKYELSPQFYFDTPINGKANINFNTPFIDGIIYSYYYQIIDILTMNLHDVATYTSFMKLRSRIILIFQRVCDEADCLNRFEYFGSLMRHKTDNRLKFELQAREDIQGKDWVMDDNAPDSMKKQWGLNEEP